MFRTVKMNFFIEGFHEEGEVKVIVGIDSGSNIETFDKVKESDL